MHARTLLSRPSGILTLAMTAACSAGALGQPAKESPAPPPAKTGPDSKAATRTAAEQLAACARKYAAAKTYRDTGEVLTEFQVKDHPFSSKKTFKTAFERGGRFRWEFTESVMPGSSLPGKGDTYTVWSKDGDSYIVYWTLDGKKTPFGDISSAMAGPTGISGGAATVIVPQLNSDIRFAIRTTDISEARDEGKENIDGRECRKISGKNIAGEITVWIDDTSAIRKVVETKVIDPARVPPPPGGRAGQNDKFTTRTTITVNPVFDEKIEDKYFEPPAEVK